MTDKISRSYLENLRVIGQLMICRESQGARPFS